MQSMNLSITTKSNLFIGSTAGTFEIGGIDAYTVVDYQGKPYIPASSIKGIFRKIVRDLEKEDEENTRLLKEAYEKHIIALKEDTVERFKNLVDRTSDYDDKVKKLVKRFDHTCKEISAEYIFGIQGFNDTPKLFINDCIFISSKQNTPFSVDTKNQILVNGDKIESNPRTYKTVCPQVVFRGEILFYHMNSAMIDITKKVLNQVIVQLNSGYYRLGNSGSRGYGLVDVVLE